MAFPVPLSVLDRSRTRRGQDPAQALRDTVEFARQVEALGYHRFWVSEHHGVPGVAGSAPTVLAAAVAANTSTIRVGTGGVMLPNHQPLVVAEQFGVLAALHPGRIDAGLGRSLGFTGGVRRALGHDKADAERFAEQVTELLSYFDGTGPIRALPADGVRLPVFVLATGAGADHAAALGLPLVIAAVRGEDELLRAVDRYRARFRPSAWSARPHLVLSSTIAVADTTEDARRLLVSEAWSAAYSRTHGVFPPLIPTDEVLALTMTDRERARFEEAMRGHPHGTPDEVADALRRLVGRTGADEVLVTTSTYDRAELLDSYRRLAALARNPAPPARVAPA